MNHSCDPNACRISFFYYYSYNNKLINNKKGVYFFSNALAYVIAQKDIHYKQGTTIAYIMDNN